MNVFRLRDTGPHGSAFDPMRTGDPLPAPGSELPLGRFGVPAGPIVDAPRRNPIGFGPPADLEQAAPPRYRTEISFRRHQDVPLPRASSRFEDSSESLEPVPGSAEVVSQSPFGHEADRGSTGSDAGGVFASGADESGDTPQAADGAEALEGDDVVQVVRELEEPKVPFYKRELSFGRRKKDRVEQDAAADEAVESSFEPAHEAGSEQEPGSAEIVSQSPFGHEADEGSSESDEGDVFASGADERGDALEVGAGADEPKVPFYKRELSLGRRKRDRVEQDAADEAGKPTSEIEATEAVEPGFEPRHEARASRGFEIEPTFAPEPTVAAGGPVAELDDTTALEAPLSLDDSTDEPVEESPWARHEPEAAGVDAGATAEDAEIEIVPAGETNAFVDPALESVDETVPSDDDAAVEEPVGSSADETPAASGRSRFSRRKSDTPRDRDRKRGGRGSRGGGKVVGLKIGASQLAAAVVSEGENGHELVELARRPLEAGVVIDGEVRDADALAHALKEFFDDHKLPRKNVRIGLASNRIGVRTLDIVGIDDDERFDNAVRFKAHEVLPVAVNESVLDYRILDERPNEAGEALRRVLLVVAPRDQVEPYVDVASRAGIQLDGIDLEALGLLRAFVEPRPFATRALDDTATVVVSIGHESTTLLVAGGGACEFTRVFDWGGGTLQDAIASELDLPHLEAATVLRHLSLTGPGRQLETLDDTARAGALDAIRQRLTPFAREFVSSLQFYQTQPESLGIGEILLTGGTSHLEGLADAMHQMIGVDVRVGDPLGRVHVSTQIDSSLDATIGSMAVPIGLAIQDDRMRTVDLLPKEARDAARKKPSLVAVAAPVAVAVPLVALGFLFTSAHGTVSDRQGELDSIEAQIAALPEPVVPQIDAALQGAQAQRALAVANVLGGRVAWDAVLNDLARVLPDNVWLSQLSAKQAPPPLALAEGAEPTAAAPAVAPVAPSGVVIDGFTYSQPDVARLLARLAALRSLTSVTLQSSAQEEVGEEKVIHFTIVADLNETGGTP